MAAIRYSVGPTRVSDQFSRPLTYATFRRSNYYLASFTLAASSSGFTLPRREHDKREVHSRPHTSASTLETEGLYKKIYTDS